MHQRIAEELACGGGILARREHPGLAAQIDRALRDGELRAVLRGIYAASGNAERLDVRTRAVALADPAAIICGEAAAVLHGWTVDAGHFIEASSMLLHDRDWLSISQRAIPPRFTRQVGRVRCTSQALTAIDLVPTRGAEAIDEALRRRVSLAELHAALAATPNRKGNHLRREALRDSRDRPWSAAERCAHRALRRAGITGWVSNHPVITDPQAPPIAFLDIAFQKLRLAVEIDGAEYHLNRSGFERDRARDEALGLLGWQVVRFSASRVLTDPEGFAASVARLVRVRSQALR